MKIFLPSTALVCCSILLWPLLLSGFPFRDYSFDELEKSAQKLNGAYAHVSSAGTLLGTGFAVSGSSKCSPSILRVTHRESLLSDVQRPQLLLSGEIHGDERVGPSATLWTALMLVHAAQCELDHNQLSCEMLRKDFGIKSTDQRVWLALLATRRESIIIPTANCLGYLQDRREDAGVDPNRDFGYSRSNDNCLRSTTARIMNALLARTLMQIVVTFHGGMVAIGYEWGSPNHPSPRDSSPDDNANAALARGMTQIGGTVPGEGSYPVGRINSLVYPVEGGMEDWMYAAGWDRGPAQLKNCTRNSNTAAPPNNRALVFLVETSDKKRPSDKELGSSEDALHASSRGNGHVPRNVRLALMTVDIVQPYVCILGASLAGDANADVLLKWHVGGSASVDSSWLAWHPATRTETQLSIHAGDHSYLLDVLQTPVKATVRNLLRVANSSSLSSDSKVESGEGGMSTKQPLVKPMIITKLQSSDGFWKDGRSQNLDEPFSVTFSAQASTASLPPGAYWLVAWAQVDKNWVASKQGNPDNLPPQSLLVNARSNPQWHSVADGGLDEGNSQSSGGRTRRQVRGRTSWPSEPILVQVAKDGRARVLAATMRCAWWARNATSASSLSSLRKDGGSHSAGPDSSKPLKDVSEVPVQLVSPGKELDVVEQEDAELGLDRGAQQTGSISLLAVAFLSCLATGTVYLSFRISALRTRQAVVLSVNNLASQAV